MAILKVEAELREADVNALVEGIVAGVAGHVAAPSEDLEQIATHTANAAAALVTEGETPRSAAALLASVDAQLTESAGEGKTVADLTRDIADDLNSLAGDIIAGVAGVAPKTLADLYALLLDNDSLYSAANLLAKIWTILNGGSPFYAGWNGTESLASILAEMRDDLASDISAGVAGATPVTLAELKYALTGGDVSSLASLEDELITQVGLITSAIETAAGWGTLYTIQSAVEGVAEDVVTGICGETPKTLADLEAYLNGQLTAPFFYHDGESLKGVAECAYGAVSRLDDLLDYLEGSQNAPFFAYDGQSAVGLAALLMSSDYQSAANLLKSIDDKLDSGGDQESVAMLLMDLRDDLADDIVSGIAGDTQVGYANLLDIKNALCLSSPPYTSIGDLLSQLLENFDDLAADVAAIQAQVAQMQFDTSGNLKVATVAQS